MVKGSSRMQLMQNSQCFVTDKQSSYLKEFIMKPAKYQWPPSRCEHLVFFFLHSSKCFTALKYTQRTYIYA